MIKQSIGVAMAEDRKEIWLAQEFSPSSTLEVRNEIMERSMLDRHKPIIVYINSYGGNVDSLNLLIDTFNEVPNDIITVCMGTAMSAGAILLSCGDHRFITKNSRVMIHEVSSMAGGTITEMKNYTDEVKKLNDSMLKTLSENTGKSINTILKLLTKKPDSYFTAKDALAFGIVDHIGAPLIQEVKMHNLLVLK